MGDEFLAQVTSKGVRVGEEAFGAVPKALPIRSGDPRERVSKVAQKYTERGSPREVPRDLTS